MNPDVHKEPQIRLEVRSLRYPHIQLQSFSAQQGPANSGIKTRLVHRLSPREAHLSGKLLYFKLRATEFRDSKAESEIPCGCIAQDSCSSNSTKPAIHHRPFLSRSCR